MNFFKHTGGLILHIPRTGGTFIANMLGRLGVRVSVWNYARQDGYPMKHSTLMHLQRTQLAQVRSVYAVVRHPLSYYESTHAWLSQAGRRNRAELRLRWKWHPSQIPADHFDEDFNTWLDKMVRYEPAWVTRLFEAYLGPEGGGCCDYVGRLEHLRVDLVKILRMLGYDCDQALNVRWCAAEIERNARKREYQWDPVLRQRVLELERPALRRFYPEDFVKSGD